MPQEQSARITIMLDSEVIDRFRALAESQGAGYQALINTNLKRVVDIGAPSAATACGASQATAAARAR